jgi:hypothetical protein
VTVCLVEFFLLNCKLSSKILDTNISYAYTDKVLDPCPWGLRVYYYNCSREGGHSAWLLATILSRLPGATTASARAASATSVG